jgi:hypothetical protein
MFEALRGLLVGEFDEWRIQVVVYRDMMKGETMIGSLLIWRDKLIIDKALYKWMRHEGFDFSFKGRPRSFSLKRDDLSTPRFNIMNDR